MKNIHKLNIISLIIIMIVSCTNKDQPNNKFTGAKGEVKLMTIDPGHFHAALVQKEMYEQVSTTVYVFAPEGLDVTGHLNRIENFNSREINPTHWYSKVYTGSDFLEKMINDHPGNVMVTAGNNRKKTEYIKAAVDEGINVLADKPMAINKEDFALLIKAFEAAEKNNVLLYDIMTERYEITTILQKELSQIPEIFGQLLKGSPEKPAISKESVHHFFKYVSGKKLRRPAWFFDVRQEGEGIVDITTHLIDLIQWECFPEQIIDYKNDINMITAKRWPTELAPSQFNAVTGLTEYPDYLTKDLTSDTLLQVYSNGEMIYKIKGVYAKVSVTWNFQAPEGTGDTHYSIMRGSKANLIIKQGAEQNYQPTLYIEPVVTENIEGFEALLAKQFQKVVDKYPGIALKRNGNTWKVLIPDKYKTGHEAHFAQITEKYLSYLVDGKLPEWEVPNMIAKYFTTTEALELARKNK
ncbi:MAG: oxidoreductase [Bacteroidales bacterium]|nr:oxidoreductase [Bacteroidales bacterium]